MNVNSICRKIQQLRIKKFGDGYGAAKKFAQWLGIKYTTYRNYEINRVSVEIIALLHEKMGVSFEWLIYDDKESFLTGKGKTYGITEQDPHIVHKTFAQHGYSKEEQEYIEKLLEIFRTKDPHLANIVEKLKHVFKEGGRSEKAWVRGVIEEAYDKVPTKPPEQKIKKGAA